MVRTVACCAVVDARGAMAADPLAPSLEVEQLMRLMAGLVGVADAPQRGPLAGLSQRLG
jgi:hypothetical protein